MPACCLPRTGARILGKAACGAILRAPAGTTTTADPPPDAAGADVMTGTAGATGAGAAAGPGGIADTGGGEDCAAGDGAESAGAPLVPPLAGFAPPGNAPPPDRCATPGTDAAGTDSWLACASMVGATVDDGPGAILSAAADCAGLLDERNSAKSSAAQRNILDQVRIGSLCRHKPGRFCNKLLQVRRKCLAHRSTRQSMLNGQENTDGVQPLSPGKPDTGAGGVAGTGVPARRIF